MTRFMNRRAKAFVEAVLALRSLNFEVFSQEFFVEGGWVILAIFVFATYSALY